MKTENPESRIVALAEAHDKNITALEAVAGKCNADLARVRQRHLPKLDRAVQAAAASEVALHNAVAESEESLWIKKRSRIVGGISFGWRKMRGKIVVKDQNATLKRADDMLKKGKMSAKQHSDVVQLVRRISLTGLARLPGLMLQKLGAEVQRDTEEVFVKDGAQGVRATVADMRANASEFVDK